MAVDATALTAQVERARAQLDEDRIADLLFAMASVPSPTGEERALAELVARHLAEADVEAEVQDVVGDQANLVARVRGDGTGPRLLLYAPLDTAFAGEPEEDRPFLGATQRADFALPPRREGTIVTGLGAENPKAFAASGVAALEAIAAAGGRPRGDVVLCLASGSMPVDRRPGIDRSPVGWGTGIRAFLESDPDIDFAIVLKPGYAVSTAEVGVAWYRIEVTGAVNYTGIRHKAPYRNPILAGARLVLELETWFADYAARHADDVVSPQASVNAIDAGSQHRASFVPVTCRLDVDVRIGPSTSPGEVDAELEGLLERAREREDGFEVALSRRFCLPGTSTPPDAWIVRALVRAWEQREGRTHAAASGTSGASDAGIIRQAGIATARIGLPPPAQPSPYAGFSMGHADASSARRLAEVLVQAALDTASRTRAEVGRP
jgi:acetylornithine deacetylase/succinyl-diaminopimelate desuccinylase-like protein